MWLLTQENERDKHLLNLHIQSEFIHFYMPRAKNNQKQHFLQRSWARRQPRSGCRRARTRARLGSCGSATPATSGPGATRRTPRWTSVAPSSPTRGRGRASGLTTLVTPPTDISARRWSTNYKTVINFYIITSYSSKFIIIKDFCVDQFVMGTD